MKKLAITIAAGLFLLAAPSYAAGADAVLGTYLTQGKDSHVLVYKCGSKYCGKIVWLKEPTNADGSPKLDTKNPSASRRSRKILGLNLVYGFKHDGGSEWSGGRIYNPKEGKTYKCTMTLQGTKLKVRGYIGYGFASVGKTVYWRKIK